MRVLRLSVLMIVCSFLAGRVAAQETKHEILVKARPAGDSIVLRWAPSSAVSWKILNKYGYRVERYTIVRDSVVLKDKPVVVLTAAPLKPAVQGQWVKYMDDDDYVAIAAQGIFGSSFESDRANTDVMTMYQMATEQESRYSFVLFAADISQRAAQLSALRFTDRKVSKNERYLYKVVSLVPPTALKIETGMAYVGLKDYKPTPVPPDPEVTFGDKQASVRWDGYSQRMVFSGYLLERSVNGGSYERVIKQPLANTATAADPYLNWVDSAYDVNAEYRYRIAGITAFGETGPFSGTAQGKIQPLLKGQVAIRSANVVNNQSVLLQWEIETPNPELIRSFVVERSASTDGKYILLKDLPVSGEKRYEDTKPMATNYYRVGAISGNNIIYSFPKLVQMEDSIPPAAPQGLRAAIDTTGRVTLQWSKNTEQDLLGYRVFRSNFKNSEYSQVTVSPTRLDNYADTVNVETLTSKIYYKIVAVDTRFNTSLFSSVVELELPDKIPPVPPALTSVRATKQGIALTWRNSSSEDVVEHRIYRKSQYGVNWQVIKVFTSRDSLSFLDKVSYEQTFQYCIRAIDRRGLASVATKPVSAKALVSPESFPKITITAVADRTAKTVVLNWKHGDMRVVKYVVYRSGPGEPLSLYKTLQSQQQKLIDSNVTMNTTYSYRVKAILGNGVETPFSEAVTIMY